VQGREEMILPNDAYPTLINAYVFRERIKRKQGAEFIGRLQRNFSNINIGTTTPGQTVIHIANFFTLFGLTEPNPTMVANTFVVVVLAPDSSSFTDAGNGMFVTTGLGQSVGSSINYVTGEVILQFSAPLTGGAIVNLTRFQYYPNLPSMGILQRELAISSTQQQIYFDTRYAYIYNSGTSQFQEWIPGTTWMGSDTNFFWPLNYWSTPSDSGGLANTKLFWVTNFSGTGGDPIRYTDSTIWVNFAPQIDNASPTPNRLQQCLAMVPFRGRMVVFNTYEGTTLASSINYEQRIRWSAIGNPISDTSALFPSAGDVSLNSWNANVRGKGGTLDIPTNESIVSVGFVRDNLVVYCEHSTWQLRYTGKTIAPFQIEKVNSELGTQSPFSSVQFDTSLVGIGDKGIVQCDSYKSERIDIKIPDLVFKFNNTSTNYDRVYGIREYEEKLAFWMYPDFDSGDQPATYPNRRLVYNYENDSWAIFEDSFTCLGYFNDVLDPTWATSNVSWESYNKSWIGRAPLNLLIAGGNQQGFIQLLDELATNQQSLFILGITGFDTTVTIINSPNHNLQSNQVILLTGFYPSDGFFSLNNLKFGVVYIDADNFSIWIYNPNNGAFDIPQVNPSASVYIGNAVITILDGFQVTSKKFNFMDEGQAIQLGFIDILMNNTQAGAITLNIYADYNTADAVNSYPLNENSATHLPDTFFNTIIPTSITNPKGSTKNWQRVYCQSRSSFITIEYTLSNGQLVGVEQQSDVQIDAQVLWMRKAGRMLIGGF
jgi:hypothetical protein